MKKLTRYLLFSLIFTYSIATLGNVNTLLGNDSINVTGMVFNNQKQVKELTIKIYSDNQLIKSVFVKSTNRFRTNVPVNSTLTIEISAPGHHPKRFIFDTHIPSELKKMPRYQFDIDIFKEEEIAGVNTSILDFPVGLVSYDAKKDEFVRNKKYTKRMKKAYLDLWEETQMSERSGIEE